MLGKQLIFCKPADRLQPLHCSAQRQPLPTMVTWIDNDSKTKGAKIHWLLLSDGSRHPAYNRVGVESFHFLITIIVVHCVLFVSVL